MGFLDDMREGLARTAIAAAGSGGAGGDTPDSSWLMKSDEDVSPEMFMKALESKGVSIAQPVESNPRAMFHDPYSVMDWGGWRQRPSALTYETLRQMSISNTVIAAIIKLRTDQVSAFCRPQQGQYDRGYRVILRDRRDKQKGMSTGEQKEAEAIERFLETTGLLLPNEKPSDRDSFRSFAKKATRDTLTYDQWCWEKIRDRRGRPSKFIALPSESIRPAVADVEHMDAAELRSRVSHVQVYENQVIAEFSTDDIAWCIQSPRSDLRANGFGFSPIEQVIRLTTAWLFGFEYNTKFFTQGSAIKGLINIKGAIPDRQLRAFRRMWYSMISGVQNAWKTPIVNAEELQWISMHSTNREMEYGSWMDWLTKLICAIYGVDPIEINFIYGASTGGSSMFSSRPNQGEVIESKDKGLRPLLTHIEDHINQHMIWEINPDFEFSFTGYDAKAEDKENERRGKQVTTHKTINEVRAEEDEEPLPGKLGDIILNPVFQAHYQAETGQGEGDGEEEGAGGDFGFEGDGGDFGAAFDDSDDTTDEDDKPRDEGDGGGGDQLASQSGGEEKLARALVPPRRQEQLRKSVDGRLKYIDIWLPKEG
jgi:phage portal protein BeeE